MIKFTWGLLNLEDTYLRNWVAPPIQWNSDFLSSSIRLSIMLIFDRKSPSTMLELLVGAAVFSSAFASQNHCYWPPGVSSSLRSRVGDEQRPCFPDQDNSPCCGLAKTNGQPEDICLSNGLCLVQVEPMTGLIVQNACTDKSWGSECPQVCDTCKYLYSMSLLQGLSGFSS